VNEGLALCTDFRRVGALDSMRQFDQHDSGKRRFLVASQRETLA
jgi:hypothetical protein